MGQGRGHFLVGYLRYGRRSRCITTDINSLWHLSMLLLLELELVDTLSVFKLSPSPMGCYQEVQFSGIHPYRPTVTRYGTEPSDDVFLMSYSCAQCQKLTRVLSK